MIESSRLNLRQIAAKKEPFLLQATIVALVVLLLAAGIWPDALQMLLGGRP
jgi:hypothetical protein